MKNILVTGGAGYIGSHTVVELSKAGYNPIILDNLNNSESFVIERLNELTKTKVDFEEIDSTDYQQVKKVFSKYTIYGVIHFAAHKAVGESVELPLKYYQNNLNSLMTILDVMDGHECENLVFSSSCTVYGEPDHLPVSEEAPVKKAESPYGNTKQIGEEILNDIFKSGKSSKFISLRYFNPIGAHPSGLIGELPLGVPNNLVPFVTQTAIGMRKELTVFGDDYNTPDGTCIRDYIHVVDLAKAHVKALEFLEGTKENYFDTFNIGTGSGSSVLDVINSFEKSTGVSLNYKIGPRRKGDVEKVYADSSKFETTMKWKAEYGLDQALIDAWNWEQKIRSWKKES